MKRILIVFLTLICSLSSFAQMKTVTSRVVDKETGEAMPYVTVFVAPGRGVITNAEGRFSIAVDGNEKIRLSFVGYKTTTISASNIPSQIKMEELANSIAEVTVLSDEALLKKVEEKLSKDYGKKGKQTAHYFNRTSLKSGNTSEMIEYYTEARSAVNLRNIMVTNGDYWATTFDGERIQSALKRTNTHILAELGPMIHGDQIWSILTIPFSNNGDKINIEKKYNFKRDAITDDGRTIYRIELSPKDETKSMVMSGKLYVDALSYELLKFDGMINGIGVYLYGEKESKRTGTVNMGLHIDYRHDKGFTEVDHIAYTLLSQDITLNTVIANVEQLNLPFTYGVRVDNNILETIANAGINTEIEEKAPIVMRTLEEENIAANTIGASNSNSTNAVAQQKRRIKNPKEIVYLHLDNTAYFKGETIWFQAYALRADTHEPTDMSKVLYVELLNPSGDVVKRRKLHLNNGVAAGDILVDSILITGYYEIRAFTRYMTNWGTEACFSKVIPIFKKPKTEGDYSNPTLDQFSFRKRLPDGRVEIDSMGYRMALTDSTVKTKNSVPGKITITSKNDFIKPCGKVSLDIHSEPFARISLSVMDAATTLNGRKGDITDYLITAPDTADADMDRLMPQPIEDKLYLYGKVKHKKKSSTPENVKLSATLYNSAGQSIKGEKILDEFGQYAFGLPDLYGEWNLIMNTKREGVAENWIVSIDRNFSPDARKLSDDECKMIPVDTTKVFHFAVKEDEPVSITHTNKVLNNVTVKARGRVWDRTGWSDEKSAQILSNVYYDCDEASDRIADDGEVMPSLCEWLRGKNNLFEGEDFPTSTMLAVPVERTIDGLEVEKHPSSTGFKVVVDYEDYDPEHRSTYDIEPFTGYIRFYNNGLTYKRRPIIWIVDNQFCTITNYPRKGGEKIKRISGYGMTTCQPITVTHNDNTVNVMIDIPDELDWVKSVYISEDYKALHSSIMSNEIDACNPVVLYVYTHRSKLQKQKGARFTHFQGYDEPSTFKMEDYSVIPPMDDYRRTIYWNPTIVTDAMGNAHVEFYNNSSCSSMFISAEGITLDGKCLTNE